MADLLFSLNTIAPMVTIISIGYIFARLGILKQEFITQGNRLCYQIFLPIQLFRSIYSSHSDLGGSLPFIIFCLGGSLLVYSIVLLISLKLEKFPEQQAGYATAFMKSNFILFGMSLAIQLLGEGNIADVAIIIAMLVPINNIVVVTVFSTLLKDKQPHKSNSRFLNLIHNILTNPIFLGAVIGLIFAELQIPLPTFGHKVVDQLADVATPLALLLLGASFKFSNVARYKKELVMLFFLKGVLIPGGALALATLMNFTTTQMVGVLVIFGSPSASSSYVMAREFGADDVLSANIVIFSTLISTITIFFCVLFLRTAGYL